ncbi:PQ-loop domain-containing transporter [Legionella rowbothamii]|uniref:PQ-loop domain-containing transporter n=1 Tax=Legionella rowbothamii TaxID=96229 RepID=UPI0010565801
MSIAGSIIHYRFSICFLVNATLFTPQIISLIKTKSAKGISLITLAALYIIQLCTMASI